MAKHFKARTLKNALRRKHVYLIAALDVKNNLKTFLSDGVVSQKQYEQLERRESNEGPTSQVELFLEFMQDAKDDQLEKFMDILKTEQNDIYEDLIKTMNRDRKASLSK